MHMAAHNHLNALFTGNAMPSSGLSGHCMYMVHINSHRHTQTRMRKNAVTINTID